MENNTPKMQRTINNNLNSNEIDVKWSQTLKGEELRVSKDGKSIFLSKNKKKKTRFFIL